MKFFIATANLNQIKEAQDMGILDGVTTNPSLMAMEGITGEKNILICKVCQLVKLIKDGQPYKMSKRKGDFITIKDVLNDVGKDSLRFMMLNRGNDVELDFDLNKVLEKNKENPVFYVQYCYARINSLYTSLNIPYSKPFRK